MIVDKSLKYISDNILVKIDPDMVVAFSEVSILDSKNRVVGYLGVHSIQNIAEEIPDKEIYKVLTIIEKYKISPTKFFKEVKEIWEQIKKDIPQIKENLKETNYKWEERVKKYQDEQNYIHEGCLLVRKRTGEEYYVKHVTFNITGEIYITYQNRKESHFSEVIVETKRSDNRTSLEKTFEIVKPKLFQNYMYK